MFLILLLSISLLSLLCTGGLIKYLSRDLLDIPNQRSSHSKPVLRGGGLGFILAFAIAGIVALITTIPDPDFNVVSYIQIWSVLAPLAIIGFVDDRQDISAGTRYLVQLSAAGIAIYNFGTIPLPWLTELGIMGIAIAGIFSLIAITAVINFYNFMDGLDGFVASITAMQLGFIAFYSDQPIFWYLVAAIAGFLWWNWSPAKIFMGDVGSTILGAAVAIALLRGQQDIIPAWSALSVTFPLIGDSIYTLIRRLAKKENIFQPHRTHIYQRLQQSGLAHSQVALVYLGVTLVSGIIILNLAEISLGANLLLTLVFLATAETYLTGIFKNKLLNPLKK